MNYIEKLDRLRVSRNWTFKKLGQLSGLSESCVKKTLYRTNKPLVSSMERMCKALGITMAELFCGKDELVVKTKAKAHLMDFLKDMQV